MLLRQVAGTVVASASLGVLVSGLPAVMSAAARDTDPQRLAEIRQVRARHIGATRRSYADMAEIFEELEHAAGIHRRLGCPVLDVTDASVEETSHRILRLVERRRAEVRGS